MTGHERKPIVIGDFALQFVVVGLFCALLVVCFPKVLWVRATAGSAGFMAACLGGGIALWFSIRLRERLCYIALLLSLPNAVIWCWFLYYVIYESHG